MELTLPNRPDRTDLSAFWMALWLIVAFAGTLVAWLADWDWAWWGIGVSAGAATLGALRPRIALRPYEAWNRLARAYGRLARTAVAGIAYYAVIALVGVAGSRLQLRRPPPESSVWSPKPTQAIPAYGGQRDEAGDVGGSWVRRLVSWAFYAEQPWIVFLVPLLVLLRGLRSDRSQTVRSDIYTLY